MGMLLTTSSTIHREKQFICCGTLVPHSTHPAPPCPTPAQPKQLKQKYKTNKTNNLKKLRNKKEKQYIRANSPDEKLDKLNRIPTSERHEEHYINPTVSGWQSRYYERLFHMDITDERRKQICFNYMEALEWTMKYYTTGCVDWRWKYKYNYAPLLEDLVKYIPYFQTRFFEKNNNSVVSPYTQLSYVLPRSSLDLLPSSIRTTLLTKHPEWYNENIDICWCFCKYFWESHMILPNIDLDELEKITVC